MPSRAETKQAFNEVSSVLRDVSPQHEEVHMGMQELALGVEAIHRECVGDVETTTQVQTTLQRMLSESSSFEMWVGQAKEQ